MQILRNFSIAIPWKVRGSFANTRCGETGCYHVMNAIKRLESHCDEASHSIQSLLNEKSAKRMKYEDEASAKAEKFQ